MNGKNLPQNKKMPSCGVLKKVYIRNKKLLTDEEKLWLDAVHTYFNGDEKEAHVNDIS